MELGGSDDEYNIVFQVVGSHIHRANQNKINVVCIARGDTILANKND